jgi:hypothetical protein
VWWAVEECAVAETWAGLSATLADARQEEARLLRDVVGNPFRPVAVELPWLTPVVVSLARELYERPTVDRMQGLAGALDEAGCSDAELLGHLRGPGPHVRGCFVLGCLLGKG